MPMDFDELLNRPREDQLILQFSTAAPDWRRLTPDLLKKFPFNLLTDKNWGSGIIRRANHSPFSHVDLVMKDGTLLGASNAPKCPHIHGNPRGVANRPPDYMAFAYRRQMVIATPRADDIRRLATTQLGKPFDNSGIRDFASDKFPGKRDWRLDECWFCAELAMWSMEMGYLWGTPPMPWPKNRVSPTDIIMMMLTDERWTNRDTFWDPIPDLKLGPGET
jgi:hypothetical protein